MTRGESSNSYVKANIHYCNMQHRLLNISWVSTKVWELTWEPLEQIMEDFDIERPTPFSLPFSTVLVSFERISFYTRGWFALRLLCNTLGTSVGGSGAIKAPLKC